MDNELPYKYQSGFLTCHSTVFQLVELYDNVCQNLESRKHTCLVVCDISKAFESGTVAFSINLTHMVLMELLAW